MPESRSMELSLQELAQRSELPFMQNNGMSRLEAQSAQLDNPALPDMPNLDLDVPMPETDRRSGQPDVTLPEGMPALGLRLAEFHVPGLERSVETAGTGTPARIRTSAGTVPKQADVPGAEALLHQKMATSFALSACSINGSGSQLLTTGKTHLP
ncbi:hypothetical protein ZHAS_00000960 [Anopheles sinensis]|uniref:Uncharacterized protein n=1 Tax=Anopheles sinensis TaxID=74873 RepID=A0A084VAT0_ANOSI|nr:hypothetical protein ZHAS_00000960 [Anopheles sinensis]